MTALDAGNALDDQALDAGALNPESAVTTTAALTTSAVADAGVTRSLLLARQLDDDETKLVDEELARGATVVEAAEKVAARRGIVLELRTLTDQVAEQPEPEAELAQRNPAELAALPLVNNVFERERQLRIKIAAEFDNFDEHVRAAFDRTKDLNEVDSALASYRFIRSRLWVQGRKNAAELFRDIRTSENGAKLLGVPIENGAHRILVEKIQPLRDARLGGAIKIKSVIGFQPRRIAESEQLSNHVFGLAIDIDAVWNPDIRSREAIEIVLRHTGVDFGRPLLARGAAVDDIYEILQNASNALREWLQLALPVEARLRHAFDNATNGVKAAETTLRKARTDSERRTAAAQLDQARAELRDARDALNASLEAFEVGVLAKEWGRRTLESWETSGLFTIAAELARQLIGLGFGWGAEYGKHKDVMHFELDPAQAAQKPQ